MTLNLQRLYVSVILGIASLGKQISRLRSWKETRRTGAFCIVYFTAWFLDLLIPLVLATLIAIVSSKEARDMLFPPAPLALVDISSGGIQTPQSGQLGTTNTLTGAPEKQDGEDVEEEAANFVENLRQLAGRAIGIHEKQQNEGDPIEKKIPKPVRNAAQAVRAAGSAPGHTSDNKDQTQKPMEEILWDKVNPKQMELIFKAAPHVVGELVDNWERFANAISPTPPFHCLSYLRIDAVLVPALLMSLFVDYYMVYKGIGFAIGLGIFGDPLLTSGIYWLNRNCPHWMELMEPKNNILRGVPTNNQTTPTLLRIGQANYTPIPPIPTSNNDDFDQKQMNAIEPTGLMEKSHPQQDTQEETPKHPRLPKIMGILKGNTKARVETKLAIDQVRAKVGSKKAKGHLGVLPKEKNLVYAGPSEFKARLDGKQGWVYITDSSLLFSTGDQGERSEPLLEIPLDEMKALKRATAFASKSAEIAADWGTEKKLLGSVEIDDRMCKTWRLTALPERDELYNRLVAVKGYRWENV
ncbi:hypothetical protein BP6252_11221 [Coleophoma cylindrospora]|uniref:Uncharacterized protein n=1 Tax=Coleophoma cylindrospora TaxID=1849047 RepID=A0A3D8QPC1_9HELO|nr:hypothetical protein BP6252_11221 [Coleophoma cylindrospora]